MHSHQQLDIPTYGPIAPARTHTKSIFSTSKPLATRPWELKFKSLELKKFALDVERQYLHQNRHKLSVEEITQLETQYKEHFEIYCQQQKRKAKILILDKFPSKQPQKQQEETLLSPKLEAEEKSPPSVQQPANPPTLLAQVAGSTLFGKLINLNQNGQDRPVTPINIEKHYAQVFLLKKINTCLRQQNKAIISENGHCHGLTLLWLLLMSYNAEDVFYGLIKEIIDCPNDQLVRLYSKVDELLRIIDFGQHPANFNNDQAFTNCYMGLKNIVNSGYENYDERTLNENLKEFLTDNKMIVMTIGYYDHRAEWHGHSLGIYCRDGKYYFYDANYKSGEALALTSFDNIHERIEMAINFIFQKQLDDDFHIRFFVFQNQPTDSLASRAGFFAPIQQANPGTPAVNVNMSKGMTP